MLLSFEEVEQFFRIHQSLMLFVNQRFQVIPEKPATPRDYGVLPPETRIKVHQALLVHRELIDAFVEENPFQLSESDLEIARSWTHLVTGTFYAFRPLQKYMVFLSSTDPVVAYGVVALFDPFEVVIGPYLPRMIKTTLLPFAGKIVYDGLIENYNITFGPGISRRLNQNYKEAKERFGIITTLPPPAGKPHVAMTKAVSQKPAPRAKTTRNQRTASAVGHTEHDKIVDLIDAVCRDHLNGEYATLCRKMADVLARKRPSPLTRGKPESWASGIVRTAGWVNFIDDPSQPDHMRLSDIDRLFHVSEATGSAKSTAIRNLLRLRRFDSEWTLPSKMDQNLMAWLIEVNGLPIDARRAPREVQEEAFRKGLIPYVPGDRGGKPTGSNPPS